MPAGQAFGKRAFSAFSAAPPQGACEAQVIGAALPIRAAHLRVERVCVKVSGNRTILDAVDLPIALGERLAIVGPNGAGKTSLLRLLSGRTKPTSGRVLLDGRALANMSLHDRARHIAVVGQNDLPDVRLTVCEYVGLGRIPHWGRVDAATHRRVITQAVHCVGLAALANRPLATLSGGERQRTSIARAVAQEPVVLILDEPTNHLDLRARADVLDLVRGLGVTVVAVLHDLTLVSPFADRVAVLRGGRLVAHGPAQSALEPAIVRDVFDMDCFPVINPATGRSLLVFDTPPPSLFKPWRQA